MEDKVAKDYQEFLLLDQQLSLYREQVHAMYREMGVPAGEKNEDIMREELFSQEKEKMVQQDQLACWAMKGCLKKDLSDSLLSPRQISLLENQSHREIDLTLLDRRQYLQSFVQKSQDKIEEMVSRMAVLKSQFESLQEGKSSIQCQFCCQFFFNRT